MKERIDDLRSMFLAIFGEELKKMMKKKDRNRQLNECTGTKCVSLSKGCATADQLLVKSCSIVHENAVKSCTMIQRNVNPLQSNSFFLLGPRGVGKSTLIESMFPRTSCFWVDLLEPVQAMRYRNRPELLLDEWRSASGEQRERGWIIIDEVQRVPALLDVAHIGIERHGLKFAMTGSSARKLRYGAANLLAGRAFTYVLHPFSSLELGDRFNLNQAINYGLLPKIIHFQNQPQLQQKFLASYVGTYLREEILAEQLVRKLTPFTRFLEVAAEANGTIINMTKLARQVRIEYRTVVRYFSLLNDTLSGFFLPSFTNKARMRQVTSPKFYFFDPGIVRAATATLDAELSSSSYLYGKFFEHFVILEIIKANEAYDKHYRLSYLKTSSQQEIDVIASKTTHHLAIEIKSGNDPDPVDAEKLFRLSRKIANCQPYIFCQIQRATTIAGVKVMPWQQGVRELFGSRGFTPDNLF